MQLDQELFILTGLIFQSWNYLAWGRFSSNTKKSKFKMTRYPKPCFAVILRVAAVG
jgi:hypothetical protein